MPWQLTDDELADLSANMQLALYSPQRPGSWLLFWVGKGASRSLQLGCRHCRGMSWKYDSGCGREYRDMYKWCWRHLCETNP